MENTKENKQDEDTKKNDFNCNSFFKNFKENLEKIKNSEDIPECCKKKNGCC